MTPITAAVAVASGQPITGIGAGGAAADAYAANGFSPALVVDHNGSLN